MYLSEHFFRAQLLAGTGDLDDLEDILSAPPPALEEPLKRNSCRAAGRHFVQQGTIATAEKIGHAEASATSIGRCGAVAVPPLALTDAHREGPRISPKSEVRCSITRAVISPRSSDIAAAVQYRHGPAALAATEQKPACRQGSTSREPVEEASAPFADTLSNFRGMGSSTASERISGWLPIHRKAGEAGSAGNTGVQVGFSPHCLCNSWTLTIRWRLLRIHYLHKSA